MSGDPLAFRFKEEFIDCSLSTEGIKQAKKAASTLSDANIRYVFVSPLKRTLLTAQIMFENHKNRPHVIVLPVIREIFASSCDIPGDLEPLKQEFPDFDFSLMDDFRNQDYWFFDTMVNQNARNDLLNEIQETFPCEEQRLKNYRAYLAHRMGECFPNLNESGFDVIERTLMAKKMLKEKVKDLEEGERIAVVSHSSFLRRFTAKNFDHTGNSTDGRQLENAEVMEYTLF